MRSIAVELVLGAPRPSRVHRERLLHSQRREQVRLADARRILFGLPENNSRLSGPSCRNQGLAQTLQVEGQAEPLLDLTK